MKLGNYWKLKREHRNLSLQIPILETQLPGNRARLEELRKKISEHPHHIMRWVPIIGWETQFNKLNAWVAWNEQVLPKMRQRLMQITQDLQQF